MAPVKGKINGDGNFSVRVTSIRLAGSNYSFVSIFIYLFILSIFALSCLVELLLVPFILNCISNFGI